MKYEAITKNNSHEIKNSIIFKIREIINFKNLEPGDKLPSERSLSEKFGVTRTNIRESIQKLEFYGILKSRPQSGTFLANIGVIAINGMIATKFHNDFTKDQVSVNVAAGTPLRREGIAEEVADLVAYLAGGESSFLTGNNVDINGGLAFS